MKVIKHSTMHRGWFIGNFSPSVLRTDAFEVGVLLHKKGEDWAPHYHAEATEYNLLLEGEMTLQDTHLYPGDIFILSPHEIADPCFLSDCKVLVVKTPSIPDDKYEVAKEWKFLSSLPRAGKSPLSPS